MINIKTVRMPSDIIFNFFDHRVIHTYIVPLIIILNVRLLLFY